MMIEDMSRKFSDVLIAKSIVPDTDREIYEYGLFVIISTLLTVSASLMIGLVVGKFIEVLIFLITFAVLRAYSGGYHAETYKKCFIYFVGVIFIFLALLNVLQSVDKNALRITVLPLVLASLWIIARYAPVDHQNAPLTIDEKRIFRMYSIVFMLVEFAIAGMLSLTNLSSGLSLSIILAVFFASILVALGHNKRRKEINQNEEYT